MVNGRRYGGTLLLVVLLSACGADGTPVPTSTPGASVASASPSPSPSPASPAPSGSGAAGLPSSSPAASPSPTMPAIVDRTLLALLPTSVDGLPMVEDVQGELQQASQLAAGKTIHGYAAAVVGDAGENVASINLVTPAFPADVTSFARTWAQQFDTAACASNGGMALTTTSIIGRYRVDISRCVGGAVIYHAILGGRAILSILELGPKELGRRVIEELPTVTG